MSKKRSKQSHNQLSDYEILCDYILTGDKPMADFRDIYKTPFMSAKTLGKKVLTVTISAAYPETIGAAGESRDKLVIEWDDGDARVALNKTNAVELAKHYGRDWNEWVGKKVIVKVGPTSYMGKPCDGVFVLVPGKK